MDSVAQADEPSTPPLRLGRMQRAIGFSVAVLLAVGVPLVWVLHDSVNACPTDVRKLQNVFPITIVNNTADPVVIGSRSTGELSLEDNVDSQSSVDICTGGCDGNRLPTVIPPNGSINETAVCTPDARRYVAWTVETPSGDPLGSLGVATSDRLDGLELKATDATFDLFEPSN